MHSPGLICIDDGDDESHWQDRVSSGFDRLVAFASIELTKSRRSIEEAPSTSPDSGINQSSDGRTFLSSSSSSSQLDAPTNLLRTVVPILKSSPAEVLDSPPPSEMPRTPSPSSSPPPIYSNPSPLLIDSAPSNNIHLDHSLSHLQHHHQHHHHSRHNNNHHHYGSSGAAAETNLKIPLKYQRQSKSSSQKHYKKKFRERTWEYDEYDKDEILSNHGSVEEFGSMNAHNNHNGLDDGHLLSSSASSSATLGSSQYNNHHNNHHHKSSKFRPKGKDWDWRSEHHRGKNHESDTAHA